MKLLIVDDEELTRTGVISWYIVIDSSNGHLQIYLFLSINLLSVVDYGVIHLYY